METVSVTHDSLRSALFKYSYLLTYLLNIKRNFNLIYWILLFFDVHVSCCSGMRLSTWSADVPTCVAPRTLSSYSDRTFAVAGHRLWNSLPVQLCNPDITYGLFRQQLERHLFRRAWTRRSVTSDMRRLRKTLTYLLTYLVTYLLIINFNYILLIKLYLYTVLRKNDTLLFVFNTSVTKSTSCHNYSVCNHISDDICNYTVSCFPPYSNSISMHTIVNFKSVTL